MVHSEPTHKRVGNSETYMPYTKSSQFGVALNRGTIQPTRYGGNDSTHKTETIPGVEEGVEIHPQPLVPEGILATCWCGNTSPSGAGFASDTRPNIHNSCARNLSRGGSGYPSAAVVPWRGGGESSQYPVAVGIHEPSDLPIRGERFSTQRMRAENSSEARGDCETHATVQPTAPQWLVTCNRWGIISGV